MRVDVSERAVAALSDSGESATARVFAARRELDDGEALRDALVAHARRQSRLYFEPPPACDRDVRRLCRAVREQGHAVDPDAVLAAAVADDRQTVLERARAVRDASGLSPSERERRLTDLLAAARAAGFETERADVLGGVTAGDDRSATGDPDSGGTDAERAGSDTQSRTNEAPSVEAAAAALTAIRAWEWGPSEDASRAAEPAVSGGQAVALDGGGGERLAGSVSGADIPDPETLSSWLVGAGRNLIEDRP